MRTIFICVLVSIAALPFVAVANLDDELGWWKSFSDEGFASTVAEQLPENADELLLSLYNEGDLDLLRTEDDADVHRDLCEIVEARNVTCTPQWVTTEDGYILTTFKLIDPSTYDHSKPPVLMQHGLLDSSYTWFIGMADRDTSLPLMLASEGFVVYLGNNRGNLFGKNHTSMDVNTKQYWEFSFGEMAVYDLPALIHHAIQDSGKPKVAYIAHSEGTTQTFAGLTINPELADYMEIFVGFGPVVSLKHCKSTVLALLSASHIEIMFEWMGIWQFFPTTALMEKIFPTFCRTLPGICDSVVEALCGPHRGAIPAERMQVMGAHEPGGTSFINMLHWAQVYRHGTFGMYDYGKKKNQQKYSSDSAPQFDLSLLKDLDLKFDLYAGTHDELADMHDVEELMNLLPKSATMTALENYAHLDFAWASEAPRDFYDEVVATLKAL